MIIKGGLNKRGGWKIESVCLSGTQQGIKLGQPGSVWLSADLQLGQQGLTEVDGD